MRIKRPKLLSKHGGLLFNFKFIRKHPSQIKLWFLVTSRHFGLNWAFVDPNTPIQNGVKFCVCVKEFLPWLRMPLQVVYVNQTNNPKAFAFAFAGGTLKGHLLVPAASSFASFINLTLLLQFLIRRLYYTQAGEERFSVEMDEDRQVWYEILSFSKPAHALSVIGYPYVFVKQKYFAHQSSEAVKKFVSP